MLCGNAGLYSEALVNFCMRLCIRCVVSAAESGDHRHASVKTGPQRGARVYGHRQEGEGAQARAAGACRDQEPRGLPAREAALEGGADLRLPPALPPARVDDEASCETSRG